MAECFTCNDTHPPKEKAVHVYTLSSKGCPKYRGLYDFRSSVMSYPGKIIIPYSPTDYPFPYLDVIFTGYNSFLVLDENINAKENTKEIYHIIWEQIDMYKFKPLLFKLPLLYDKRHLLELMYIIPNNYQFYQLWQIREHQLYRQVEKSDHGDLGFNSIVMMKVIPFKTDIINIHARFSFYYIGKEKKFFGTPLIFGLYEPNSINKLLHNFYKFAPKWLSNYEVRFVLKNNDNTDSQPNTNQASDLKGQNNAVQYLDTKRFIFTGTNKGECDFFQIICKLIDKDS